MELIEIISDLLMIFIIAFVITLIISYLSYRYKKNVNKQRTAPTIKENKQPIYNIYHPIKEPYKQPEAPRMENNKRYEIIKDLYKNNSNFYR